MFRVLGFGKLLGFLVDLYDVIVSSSTSSACRHLYLSFDRNVMHIHVLVSVWPSPCILHYFIFFPCFISSARLWECCRISSAWFLSDRDLNPAMSWVPLQSCLAVVFFFVASCSAGSTKAAKMCRS